MKHISREDLLYKIDELCKLQNCGTKRCQNCSIGKIEKIITKYYIHNKIGQWIICSDGYYPYCSICGEEPPGREMTDYCPRCGAYMKGDKLK